MFLKHHGAHLQAASSRSCNHPSNEKFKFLFGVIKYWKIKNYNWR